MTIFHFAFFLILLLNVLMRPKDSRAGRKAFCIISGFIYFAISAFRGYSVGNDTSNYFATFQHISRWSSVHIGDFRRDPVFYISMWGVGRLTGNYSIFLFLIALFFTVSCWLYIYRHSEDPCLSIIFLLAFNLYQFTLTGQRQTVAMSFILLAIMALERKKTTRAIVFTILGAQFHMSAYVFLIMPLLYKRKPQKTMLYASLPVIVAIFLLRTVVAGVLVPYISERDYGIAESSSGFTMAFVVFVLYVFAVLFLPTEAPAENNSGFLYWMMMIAVAFEMLVTAQNIFFRFAFYFLLGGAVLIPHVIHSMKRHENYIIANLGLYVLLSIQYLVYTLNSSGITPYQFVWQM